MNNKGKGEWLASGCSLFTHENSYFSFLLCSHTVNSNRTLLWGFPQLTNDNKPENGGKTNGMMDWRTKRRKIRELSGGFPSLRTRHQFLAFWHRRTLEIFVSETIVWYLTIHHWRFTSLYWEPSVWRNYRTKILFQTNWPLAFEHQY